MSYNEDANANERTKKQVFYINEDGEIIIESSRGYYVNGVAQHKIVGEFCCNARTMALILERYINSPIKTIEKDGYIVIEETKACEELQKHAEMIDKCCQKIIDNGNDVSGLKMENDKLEREKNELEIIIDIYNSKPWWYRLFHKISVK